MDEAQFVGYRQVGVREEEGRLRRVEGDLFDIPSLTGVVPTGSGWGSAGSPCDGWNLGQVGSSRFPLTDCPR